MADLVIDLLANDDLLTEGPESFTVDLATPASSTGADIGLGNASVTTMINDNDQSTGRSPARRRSTKATRPVYTIALSGTLQAGEIATINLSLSDVSTDSADYAAFEAAVNAAIGTRTDLTFVGGVLTYTGDGNPMADLVINLDAIDDALSEGPESFTVDLDTPASTTGADIGLGNASRHDVDQRQ